MRLLRPVGSADRPRLSKFLQYLSRPERGGALRPQKGVSKSARPEENAKNAVLSGLIFWSTSILTTNELVLSTIVDALEDVKGQDIRVYNTTKKTSAFSHVVICSGTSNRQTRALANSVSRALKDMGHRVNGIEGGDTGEWVLLDAGDVVVHCLQPAMRAYYNLEELWGPDLVKVPPLVKPETKAQTDATPGL